MMLTTTSPARAAGRPTGRVLRAVFSRPCDCARFISATSWSVVLEGGSAGAMAHMLDDKMTASPVVSGRRAILNRRTIARFGR
jgi:hypothetical protein